MAAEFERPVLLFSGGKDSIVMLRLAEKAFAPARIPFPVMHVDTGLNFDSILEYRDTWADRLGLKLVVAESESRALERWLGSREDIVSSNLARSEVVRAVRPSGGAALRRARRKRRAARPASPRRESTASRRRSPR